MKATYNVFTWDASRQAYTPHDGLRTVGLNVDIYGLRRSLRELRDEWGYACSRVRLPNGGHGSDPSVLVERIS